MAKSRAFYETLFGYKAVWEPDANNVYLSSGSDNLALHRIEAAHAGAYEARAAQFLDHLGVIMESPETVDRLWAFAGPHLTQLGASVVKPPKRHRDGSYSFYLADPDGNVVQVLYEPNISSKC